MMDVVPLFWVDRSEEGMRLFTASTPIGNFSYGTDRNGQSYSQGPGLSDKDAETEEKAKADAEDNYRVLAARHVEGLFYTEGGTDYFQGFVAGLKEGARTLREAAKDHYEQSIASKKVLENQAHQLAASLFVSWANALDIRADNFRG